MSAPRSRGGFGLKIAPASRHLDELAGADFQIAPYIRIVGWIGCAGCRKTSFRYRCAADRRITAAGVVPQVCCAIENTEHHYAAVEVAIAIHHEDDRLRHATHYKIGINIHGAVDPDDV